MFDKHTHTLIAQRLDQAEKQREQIRAISLDYPEITIEEIGRASCRERV